MATRTTKPIVYAADSVVEDFAQAHIRSETTVAELRDHGAHSPYFVNLYNRVADRVEQILARRAPSVVLYRAIATSNDVTTCECCGRQNLKKTIVIQTIEDGAAMGERYYGIDCAATLTGASKKRVTQAARALTGASNPKPWKLFA